MKGRNSEDVIFRKVREEVYTFLNLKNTTLKTIFIQSFDMINIEVIENI